MGNSRMMNAGENSEDAFLEKIIGQDDDDDDEADEFVLGGDVDDAEVNFIMVLMQLNDF